MSLFHWEYMQEEALARSQQRAGKNVTVFALYQSVHPFDPNQLLKICCKNFTEIWHWRVLLLSDYKF
jgi:hypothetical protein